MSETKSSEKKINDFWMTILKIAIGVIIAGVPTYFQVVVKLTRMEDRQIAFEDKTNKTLSQLVVNVTDNQTYVINLKTKFDEDHELILQHDWLFDDITNKIGIKRKQFKFTEDCVDH